MAVRGSVRVNMPAGVLPLLTSAQGRADKAAPGALLVGATLSIISGAAAYAILCCLRNRDEMSKAGVACCGEEVQRANSTAESLALPTHEEIIAQAREEIRKATDEADAARAATLVTSTARATNQAARAAKQADAVRTDKNEEATNEEATNLYGEISYMVAGQRVRTEYAIDHKHHGTIKHWVDGKHTRTEYAAGHEDHGVIHHWSGGKHVRIEYALGHEKHVPQAEPVQVEQGGDSPKSLGNSAQPISRTNIRRQMAARAATHFPGATHGHPHGIPPPNPERKADPPATPQRKVLFARGQDAPSPELVDGGLPPPSTPLQTPSSSSPSLLQLAVDSPKSLVKATVGATMAVSEGTEHATKLVLSIGSAAFESTAEAFSAIGAASIKSIETMSKLDPTAGFQWVFGANVDESDEGLAKTFASVDTDASGSITADEFRGYINKVHGKGLDEGTLQAMISSADTNHDGKVDLDDFKAALRRPSFAKSYARERVHGTGKGVLVT